jgi:hypothetical protein
VATIICDKLIVHSVKWDWFKYSIYSFLFGVLSYFSFQLFQDIGVLIKQFLSLIVCSETKSLDFSRLGVWDIINNENAKIPLDEVAYSTLFFSPLVAVVASLIVNYKLINKIAQKFRISQKYGDENLFSYFLNSKDVYWIYVRDKEGGITYFGILASFSECDSIQEIVLKDVTVYKYETSEEMYSLPLIYLSKPLGAFVIEVPEVSAKEEV